MGIKDIFEMFEKFEKYGAKGIIFLLIIIIGYTLFKVKWIGETLSKLSNSLIEKITKKKEGVPGQKTITESHIVNHDIFNYIDFWMYSKIPTFQFSTEYRTVVFRKYLTIYLKSYKDTLGSYIGSKAHETMDDAQIWKSFLALINDVIYKYEKEMEQTGIPKVIIEKMKIKNNDTISLTIDLIEGICTSQFYSSEKNLLKIYSILNIMLSILENTISNSDNICNSINGQLKGLSMDGKTEP